MTINEEDSHLDHWRILLDLDGTVAQNAGRRIAARHFGLPITEEHHGESLLESLGLNQEQFWAWWHDNQVEIYDQADPLPGAAETLRRLKAGGAHIAVVTARRQEAEAVTVAWLDRYGFPYDEAVFGADDKLSIAQALNLSIGFEDDPKNALALAEVMPMILIDNAKNRTFETTHPQVHRVTGWHEVEPLLQRLAARTA